MSNLEQMVSVRYMVDDVQAAINFYTSHLSFRNEVVTGLGGKQALIEDPAGNEVELFEPASGTPARR